MTEEDASAPFGLRITSATLVGIAAFGLVFAVVLVGCAIARVNATGGTAIALLALVSVGGIVAGVAAARRHFRVARSWRAWSHLAWIVVTAFLCWLLAPEPATFIQY